MPKLRPRRSPLSRHIESLEIRCLLTTIPVLVDTGQSFISPDYYTAFVTPHAVADIDGDGDLDAVMAAREGSRDERVDIWVNDGNGNFTDTGQRLDTREVRVIDVGDVDGDGDIDIVLGQGSRLKDPDEVWLNDGTGTFTSSGQDLGTEYTHAISLADLDGDSDLDMVVTGYSTVVRLNDGSGNFTDDESFSGRHAHDIADLDGDGDLDVISERKVFLNDGAANFTEGQDLGANADAITIGDVDGNGTLDVLLSPDHTAPRLWLNDGTATFTDAGFVGGGRGRLLDLADMDGDGDLDLVQHDFDSGNIWQNDGTGDFSVRMSRLDEVRRGLDFALGDFDGDTDIDMLSARRVYLNEDAIALPGSGGTYRVLADGTDVTVLDGAMEIFRQNAASTRFLPIQGGSSDDTIIIDFSQGEPLPGGLINVRGGNASNTGDRLKLDGGTFSNIDYWFPAHLEGVVNFGDTTISFDDAVAVTDDLAAVKRSFQFHQERTTVDVSDNGAASDGRSLLEASTYVDDQSIEFRNPFWSLVVTGGERRDTINLAVLDDLFAADVMIDGGDDPDLLDASGFDRDVTLIGGDRSDTLIGGSGNDHLDGGDAGDRLIGGAGHDILEGGEGNDEIHGDAGNDTLNGFHGYDVMDGGAGQDQLFGGAHRDTLSGGDGNDFIKGQGGGGDRLQGGAGDDTLDGGRGEDWVVEVGDVDMTVTDTELTALGTDILRDIERAWLTGGASDNVLDATSFSGSGRMNGGGGDDTLRAGDSHYLLNGHDGNDLIIGGIGNDTLVGGRGNDSLDAGDGDDGISGHDGHDTLSGGSGDDTLIGGDGDDQMFGGSDQDAIVGGDGDDYLSGQGGSKDTLTGGAGDDTVIGTPSEIDEAFTFNAPWV